MSGVRKRFEASNVRVLSEKFSPRKDDMSVTPVLFNHRYPTPPPISIHDPDKDVKYVAVIIYMHTKPQKDHISAQS